MRCQAIDPSKRIPQYKNLAERRDGETEVGLANIQVGALPYFLRRADEHRSAKKAVKTDDAEASGTAAAVCISSKLMNGRYRYGSAGNASTLDRNTPVIANNPVRSINGVKESGGVPTSMPLAVAKLEKNPIR